MMATTTNNTQDAESRLADIRDNLETQLAELESLQSMFCNPGEIMVEDSCILYDIKEFVYSKTNVLPNYLDLTVNLDIESKKFELCVTLPHKYPHVEPELFVRNSILNRYQHTALNRDLSEYICKLEKGEPCIFSAISWLQENAERYYVKTNSDAQTNNTHKGVNEPLMRYWIYSHHIYNKTKRREIVDHANQLQLTGFCMPGKPGIICIEGAASVCNEWWQSIRSMTWKKIFIKVTEEDKREEEVFQKFEKFEEVVFQNSGHRFNHMDMGELFRYLEEHCCGYIFKDLFGVETRTTS